MVSGTKMKWKTVVIPNCQRERSSVIGFSKLNCPPAGQGRRSHSQHGLRDHRSAIGSGRAHRHHDPGTAYPGRRKRARWYLRAGRSTRQVPGTATRAGDRTMSR